MNKLPLIYQESVFPCPVPPAVRGSASSASAARVRDKSAIASLSSVGRALSTLIVLNAIEGPNRTLVLS
jgi:hypothetical protein